MKLLTNICNPKEQHFQQQARTQTYKPLNEYVFQNRNLDKMRRRYETTNAQNPQQFRNQSWNRPYSISNFAQMQQNQGPINKQSINVDYANYENQLTLRKQNDSKKISFKDIPQAICGVGNDREEGEKHFPRNDFYSNQAVHGMNDYGYSSRNYYQGNHQERSQYSSKFNGTSNRNDERYYERSSNGRYHHEQLGQEQSSSVNRMEQSHLVLSKELLLMKQQNKELKRLIDQEYEPMKQICNKLLSEQEQREYLITKLQWKVKELVKQMGGNGSLSGFLDEGKDKTVRNENKNTHNINDNRHNMSNLGGTINRNNSNEAYYGQTNLNYSQIVSNLVMQNYGGAGFDIQQNSSNLGNKGFPGQYNSEQGHQTPFYQPQVVAHNSYPSQQSTYQSSQLITTSAQAPSSYYSSQSNIQQYRPQFNSPHKVTNFNSNRINY